MSKTGKRTSVLYLKEGVDGVVYTYSAACGPRLMTSRDMLSDRDRSEHQLCNQVQKGVGRLGAGADYIFPLCAKALSRIDIHILCKLAPTMLIGWVNEA